MVEVCVAQMAWYMDGCFQIMNISQDRFVRQLGVLGKRPVFLPMHYILMKVIFQQHYGKV